MLHLFHNKELEQYVFSYPQKKIDQKCDVAIIFGGSSMIPYRVDAGIKLYQEKKVKKILVSGKSGYLNHPKKTEAQEMYEYLTKQGIPKEDILIEDASKSTKENVLYSLQLLEKDYDIKSLSYILITSDFHLKRCFGLFSNYLASSKNIYGIGVEDHLTDISNWEKTKYGKRTIRREALLLWYYSKKGISFE